MTSHINDTDHTLQHKLQQLKDQLPNLESHSEEYKQWWQKNGQAWIKQLRTVMINYRNIGHYWQFSNFQKELLKQYYNANKLLVNYLRTGFLSE